MTLKNNKESKKELRKLNDDLIVRIARGDEEALYQLYYATQNSVFGYILSIVKNSQDAEDIMQDTYLKIQSKASQYVPCNKPLAWILTIAKHLCLMKLRQKKHCSFLNYEDLENEQAFASDDCSVDQIVLQAALNCLDERSRQIVILHAVTGLKHKEIAQALNLPLSTVLSNYSRSIKKLKKYLSEIE